MPVRAVVLPATPLLVPGAAGAGDALVATRAAVAEALDLLLADLPPGAGPDAPVMVLAPTGRIGSRAGSSCRGDAARDRASGPAARHLRPSLGGAGIADRWIPGVTSPRVQGSDGVAHVPASVALLCLDAALEARDAGRGEGGEVEVVTVELPAGRDDLSAADADAVAAALRTAAAVVVADAGAPPGSHPEARQDPETATALVLDRHAAAAGWRPQTRAVAEDGDHLAPTYPVTVYRTADDATAGELDDPAAPVRRTVSG